jgi:hypothetical protein
MGLNDPDMIHSKQPFANNWKPIQPGKVSRLSQAECNMTYIRCISVTLTMLQNVTTTAQINPSRGK